MLSPETGEETVAVHGKGEQTVRPRKGQFTAVLGDQDRRPVGCLH